MKLTIPDDVARSAELNEQQMLEMLALMLFSQGKLSSGYASKLAGMSRHEFYDLMGAHDVYYPYTVEDLRQDMKTLESLDLPFNKEKKKRPDYLKLIK